MNKIWSSNKRKKSEGNWSWRGNWQRKRSRKRMMRYSGSKKRKPNNRWWHREQRCWRSEQWKQRRSSRRRSTREYLKHRRKNKWLHLKSNSMNKNKKEKLLKKKRRHNNVWKNWRCVILEESNSWKNKMNTSVLLLSRRGKRRMLKLNRLNNKLSSRFRHPVFKCKKRKLKLPQNLNNLKFYANKKFLKPKNVQNLRKNNN